MPLNANLIWRYYSKQPRRKKTARLFFADNLIGVIRGVREFREDREIKGYALNSLNSLISLLALNSPRLSFEFRDKKFSILRFLYYLCR